MSNERRFTLKVTEDELKAIINHHAMKLATSELSNNPDVETTARIHDLTKRLNRETPEIEGDPRPVETKGNDGW